MANRHDAKAPISNGFRLTDPRRLGGYNHSVPDSDPLRREQSGNRRPFDIRRPQRKVILRHDRKIHFKRKTDLHECEPKFESDSDCSAVSQADHSAYHFLATSSALIRLDE